MKESMTIGEFVKTCLAKWKWFAVSVCTMLLLAIAYLVVTPPKYIKKAQILVKDESAMGALMGQDSEVRRTCIMNFTPCKALGCCSTWSTRCTLM